MMALNQDALADMVVMLVKNAMAPTQERLAAAEARLAMLGDLRDRVVTMEVKSAVVPAQPEPISEEEVERVTAAIFQKEFRFPATS